MAAYKRNPRTTEPTTCVDCGETKPASDFYSNAPKANGLMSRCKPCHKGKANARHKAKRSAAAAKDPLAGMRHRIGSDLLPASDPDTLRTCYTCRQRFNQHDGSSFSSLWECRRCDSVSSWLYGYGWGSDKLGLADAMHLRSVFARDGRREGRLPLLCKVQVRLEHGPFKNLPGRGQDGSLYDLLDARDRYYRIPQRIDLIDEYPVTAVVEYMQGERPDMAARFRERGNERKAALERLRRDLDDMALRMDAIAAELGMDEYVEREQMIKAYG